MTLEMGSVRGGCDVTVIRRRVAENVHGAGGITPPPFDSICVECDGLWPRECHPPYAGNGCCVSVCNGCLLCVVLLCISGAYVLLQGPGETKNIRLQKCSNSFKA